MYNGYNRGKTKYVIFPINIYLVVCLNSRKFEIINYSVRFNFIVLDEKLKDLTCHFVFNVNLG